MKSFFTWNMRGFNESRKHSALRKWVHSNNHIFGGLIETRVRVENHQRIMDCCLPGWNSITNYDYHHLGRIWVCYSDEVTVTVLHKSSQIITCAISDKCTNTPFMCSFVYASNLVTERQRLWSDLCSTQQYYSHLSIPWIVLGDFNEILSTAEHSRATSYMVMQSGMKAFQDAVSSCGLNDLAYVGPCYTWSNNREGNPIGKKLDRALHNSDWLTAFPQSYATFDSGGISDHTHCTITLTTETDIHKKPFRFFNFLTNLESFIPTIREIWDNTTPLFHSRRALYLFHKKLKLLKPVLRTLNKDNYGGLPTRTKAAFDVLCAAQNKVLENPNPQAQAEVSEASLKWHHLASIEEQFYKQKSRIQWLATGDQNTTFFHRVVQSRTSKNTFRRLVSDSGEILIDIMDIKGEAVSYYKNLLQHIPDNLVQPTTTWLSNLVDYRCSDSSAATLLAPVTSEEIRKTIFSMPTNKAPGPDGYNVEFYKSSWAVIGQDCITAVQSFFLYGFLPQGINATMLSLIPKTDNAQHMKDYRPIACCNLIYKVISKIVANRFKTILPEAIDLNQSAFIKGRLLLENVILATELVKNYNRTSVTNRCAIKFDISKAFDTVQWHFITAVLEAMNIPTQFIHWIRLCISTATFSLSINGGLEGFFKSNRGLRQGCSLSPYLYVVINNVLSKMLNRAAEIGQIGYHSFCRDVKLTHLIFADDILVFTDGKRTSISGVIQVFEEFAKISGLQINGAKSSLYAAGSGSEEAQTAALDNGLTVGTLPIRYLGLPLTTKTMNRIDYEPLIDKIRTRLFSWTARTLSFAGRLQLIKSVIASITNFWCSVFRLSKSCLHEIESMCSAFLWSGSPTNPNKSKVSWADVCQPKEEGGLGIRRLRDTSRVFALCLIWRLFSLKASLWVAWTRKYLLKDSSFWDVKKTTKGSWIWHKLLQLRDLASSFIRYKIGDGRKASFWYDRWLMSDKLLTTTGPSGPSALGVPLHATVSLAVCHSAWCIRAGRSRHHLDLINKILAEPVPHEDAGPDVPLWCCDAGNFKESFSAKATWEQLRERGRSVPWYRVVWFPQAIPRQSFIVWLAVKNRLSTGDRMRVWGRTQICTLCGDQNETRDHIFFACPFSYTVWLSVAGKLLGRQATPDWTSTLRTLQKSTKSNPDHILLRLGFQATIYHLWKERNTRIHKNHHLTVAQISQVIFKLIKNRISSLGYRGPHKLEGLLRRWFELHQ